MDGLDVPLTLALNASLALHGHVSLRPMWVKERPHFFFQAEDGIRDVDVTGVQTCALPIFASATWTSSASEPFATSIACAVSRPKALQRSEERRVGKECRSRWSPYL